MYNTTVLALGSGEERRNQNWQYPKHAYDVSYGVRTQALLESLIEFFHAVAGRAYGFRYLDPHDYKSCLVAATPAFGDQVIGTGTGALTTFQLKKTYTKGANSRVRLIKKPVLNSVLIGKNGANQTSGWSVNTTTGVVTFDSAPANGHVVTAGYEFDVPCRFDVDQLSVVLEDIKAASTQIPVVETRAIV